MSPESQRVALAELCGAVWIVIGEKPLKHYRMLTMVFNPEYCERASGDEVMCNPVYMWEHGKIPDYLNSLDAMREVEETLTEDKADIYGKDERCRYITHLGSIIGCWNPGQTHNSLFQLTHATAAQKAKALLVALGKWVE